MEKHALTLIDLYIELQRKQEELGTNIEKALGLNKGEVTPALLDSSIGKVESLILDSIEVSEDVKSHIWGNGILYKFYLDYGQNAEKILTTIKKFASENNEEEVILSGAGKPAAVIRGIVNDMVSKD